MTLRLSHPSLVVIDVQNAIDDPRWGPRNNPNAETVIAALLAAFRQRSLPVLHIRHDSADSESAYRPGQPGNDFKTAAQPLADEPVIAKQTNSAFIGTDLADRLRGIGGDVVYAGVITNNSLEASVRMSGNLGFESFVASDGCWSVDRTDLSGKVWAAEDVHQLSLANLHKEYAIVTTSTEIIAALA